MSLRTCVLLNHALVCGASISRAIASSAAGRSISPSKCLVQIFGQDDSMTVVSVSRLREFFPESLRSHRVPMEKYAEEVMDFRSTAAELAEKSGSVLIINLPLAGTLRKIAEDLHVYVALSPAERQQRIERWAP